MSQSEENESPVDVFGRKLRFLQGKLATANAVDEFSIKENIRETRQHIIDLGGDPDTYLRADSAHQLSSAAEDWPHPDLKVSIAHLPRPGQHFVGREDELAILDDAWLNQKTNIVCLLYTSPSPRDLSTSRMPSSA